MMLELAIGDAYGAGFEYVRDRRFINRHNSLAGYVKHPRHGGKPGRYTDDTQMSIAIVELMLADRDWAPETVAESFLEVFHRDKRPGYAGGFFRFLKATRTADDFIRNIRPTSDKSGAAMRAGPIGLLPDISEVIGKCTVQARLTHDTPDGINAAVAAALMVHFFTYGLGKPGDLPGFLVQHVPGQWDEPWQGEVGSRGWMSVRAAITSVVRNESLAGVLRSCVAWSGDVDTVATIALAAAAQSRFHQKDLPEVLVSKLENGKYGRDYLVDLDRRLRQKFAPD